METGRFLPFIHSDIFLESPTFKQFISHINAWLPLDQTSIQLLRDKTYSIFSQYFPIAYQAKSKCHNLILKTFYTIVPVWYFSLIWRWPVCKISELLSIADHYFPSICQKSLHYEGFALYSCYLPEFPSLFLPKWRGNLLSLSSSMIL